MTSGETKRGMAWFLLLIVGFYVLWIALVLRFEAWDEVVAHWPIAVSMAVGSYFAGSTPVGGGTVGFPVLVLLFDLPAALGRNFGFAVQSVGMTSASLYIFVSRTPVDRPLLVWATLGSLLGTPLGAAFIAPVAAGLLVKLLFGVLWCSFGLLHLIRMKDILRGHGVRIPSPGLDRRVGLVIGVFGGVVASLTGVGIDLLVYAALVLFYRADIKVAIPTSVVLMAVTSIIGIVSNLVLASIDPERFSVSIEVFYNWLAATPIVILGAPFGALIVDRIRRQTTLFIVSTLCIAQFIWTLFHERVMGAILLGSILGVVLITGVLLMTLRTGEKRNQAQRPERT